MKLEGLSILGSGRVKAAGKPTPAINPATGAALGPDYFWAAAADVEQAVRLAAQAFAEFRSWPPGRNGRRFRIHGE